MSTFLVVHTSPSTRPAYLPQSFQGVCVCVLQQLIFLLLPLLLPPLHPLHMLAYSYNASAGSPAGTPLRLFVGVTMCAWLFNEAAQIIAKKHQVSCCIGIKFFEVLVFLHIFLYSYGKYKAHNEKCMQ